MGFHFADPTELSDADLRALYELELALHEESEPEDPFRSPEAQMAYHRSPRPETHRRVFLAREDDRIVGAGWVFWRLGDENRHLARVVAEVMPDRRRRGLGRELAAAAADHAAADGRDLVQSWTSSRQPAGEEFSRAVGAEIRQVNHENRLRLAEVDTEQLRRWVEAGEALPDYELVFVELPMPEELLVAAAEIANVMNTAPRDDLNEEDETITPERLAAGDAAHLAGGGAAWRTYARHRPTGALVGLTELYWLEEDRTLIEQGDTGVLPAHRGHGLAKWLKASMLQRLLAQMPDARAVVTGNAYSNDAMLAINHALGFRPAGAWTVWEVATERLRYTSAQSARPLE